MNRAEAEMIARAARILRPDWITSSLMTILEEFADQPTRRVHLALVWLAHDPDTKTPGRLRQPGPWWELDKPEQQAPTLPPPPPRAKPRPHPDTQPHPRNPATGTTRSPQVTDTTACIRGCVIPKRHAGCADQDACPGCLPARCETGSLLCRACEAKLAQLLGDTDEGVEWITRWLADNLGQHVNHVGALGGRGGNPDSRMDKLVAVASVMSEMQIAIMEIAEDFAEHHGITPPARQDGHMAALGLLRRWSGTLRRWEPAGDALDELLDLRSQAHAVAPWRPQHGPNADQYAAKLTLEAPPETTEEVCKRFGITAERLRQAKRRGSITPTGAEGRELLWRPWDVFAWLHPAEAQEYLKDMPNWSCFPRRKGLS